MVRDGAWHNVVEYNVTALVEGDIDVRSVHFASRRLARGILMAV